MQGFCTYGRRFGIYLLINSAGFIVKVYSSISGAPATFPLSKTLPRAPKSEENCARDLPKAAQDESKRAPRPPQDRSKSRFMLHGANASPPFGASTGPLGPQERPRALLDRFFQNFGCQKHLSELVFTNLFSFPSAPQTNQQKPQKQDRTAQPTTAKNHNTHHSTNNSTPHSRQNNGDPPTQQSQT